MHSDHAIKLCTANCLMKTKILSSNSSLGLNVWTSIAHVPRHSHFEGPIKNEKIPPKISRIKLKIWAQLMAPLLLAQSRFTQILTTE